MVMVMMMVVVMMMMMMVAVIMMVVIIRSGRLAVRLAYYYRFTPESIKRRF
jgi:hypothetical protein